jgi:hypothetical protein
MQLIANLLDNLFHRTPTDFSLFDFAGPPVDDFKPQRFSIKVHGFVKACDKFSCEERPVLFRQGQHFGHFLSGNAHAARISPFPAFLASPFGPGHFVSFACFCSIFSTESNQENEELRLLGMEVDNTIYQVSSHVIATLIFKRLWNLRLPESSRICLKNGTQYQLGVSDFPNSDVNILP